jgi:hypothetical protein
MATPPRKVVVTKPPHPEVDVPLVEQPDARMASPWWQWLTSLLRWYRFAAPSDKRPLDLDTSSANIGFQMFDTDLGIPIWWDGTQWIDATAGASIIEEAPLTGEDFVRSTEASTLRDAGTVATWKPITVLPPRPVDNYVYGLKDNIWTRVAWSDLVGVPTTFAPAAHTHPESEVVNLVSDLASKAALVHTHTESQITGLVADLAAKAPLANPAFTGNPTAPTAALGDNDTSLATTAFVTAAIAAIPPTGLSTAEYTYSTTPGVPPSTGQLRTNNPVPQTGITQFYLSYINANTVDIRNALRLIKAPNTVLVQDKTNAVNHHYFEVTGDAVDGGTYFTIPVVWTSGGPNFTPGRVIFAVFGLGS